ncbi:hypothetical protein HPB47_026419, partial [Ixodes persulcatus]
FSRIHKMVYLHRACADARYTTSQDGLPPEEAKTRALQSDPADDITKARLYRRAYLSAAAGLLLTPSPPSHLFSHRRLVTLQQIQSGSILTPCLIHRSPKGQGALLLPLPYTSGSCQIKADMEHLPWVCPLYSKPRTLALTNIQQDSWPTSLRTWVSPDPFTLRRPPSGSRDRCSGAFRTLQLYLLELQ